MDLGLLITIVIAAVGVISAILMIRAYKKQEQYHSVIIPYGIATVLHGTLVTIHSLAVGPVPLLSFIIPVINTAIMLYIITREDYKTFK